MTKVAPAPIQRALESIQGRVGVSAPSENHSDGSETNLHDVLFHT